MINRITFGTDKAARAAFQQMLREVQSEGQPLGSIDFNKLAPMPPELNIESGSRTREGLKLYQQFMRENIQIIENTPRRDEQIAALFRNLDLWLKKDGIDPEVWKLGEKAYRNIREYGSPTWYEWHRLHWGSKWNAYYCVPLDKTAGTMEFQTADNAVPKIAALLSGRFPAETVTYGWFGLDLTQGLGRMVFRGGKAVSIDVPQDELSLACAMSSGVWRFGVKEEQAAEDGPRHKKPGRRGEPER